eukprot:TRINITY_DN39_c0_g1_i2.p1 TRINITY_DN39_c0_g1~~TRINITY_DN39_c0_g1_i2.p1  ORF type:complete len:122 (+),score=17.17 TRINITY_DN39_c0_g1_i2:153-518(+)
MEAVIPEGIAVFGAYTPAIKANGFIFCSGQIGASENGVLPSDIKEQTKNALHNVKTVLEAAGSHTSKVVKATVFITDMEHFADVNQQYSQFFLAPYPCRSCVAVRQLPKGALVEIEVIALQ